MSRFTVVLKGNCQACGAGARRVLAGTVGEGPAAVDELMARHFLDPRMHVALKVLCQVCGRGTAAECADLERDGEPFSRMEFAPPERPPAVLWSRSGSRGVWTAAGAVLTVENTHANSPEEAAREALDRLRDHAPMTGIFLWGSDPHR